ncbi:MAG TPA: acetyl-CoA decarbonylase/synthase complex subunit gamma [Dehalococcoidia bacterium]|nr:acetyl-CoA decarbonylase/synthase complex subunit gamma [Dehalococcoidia bacterium]
MALTGIEIYKLLPKTNCKKCGFPTCLAFAMKVAQKGIEITACPDLTEEARGALEAAARPPIRLVTVGSDEHKFEVGNEVVLFRHEKTFYHPPALMVRVKDNLAAEERDKLVSEVSRYSVERVGIVMSADGFAIDNDSRDAGKFAACVESVTSQVKSPLVLMATDPAAMEAALAKAAGRRPLIYAATRDNLDRMVELAKTYNCPLAVSEPAGLSELAELTERAAQAGVEDLVIDPGATGFSASLQVLTQLRRLAIKKMFQPLGYPIITFPGDGATSVEEEAMLAGQHIAKYAGIIVLNHFSPATLYPLLTLRLNIYTDPQKPIRVQPGIYQIGEPKDSSPLCVTTNFSLTYFSIAGELESSGFPSWLLVCDTEGLSVLTAWAAGKFDADRIAKSVKEYKANEKINHNSLILPGKVAVLRGELEEELPDWKIRVGPLEAMDVGSYLKTQWKP